MSEAVTLECSHCGGDAIEADADGMFTDGDGDSCLTCGFPGHVVCDSETAPYWSGSDAADAFCGDPVCDECEEYRHATGYPSLRATQRHSAPEKP